MCDCDKKARPTQKTTKSPPDFVAEPWVPKEELGKKILPGFVPDPPPRKKPCPRID